MAVWITPRPKDDVLPPRTRRLAPRRSSILFRLLSMDPFPLLVGCFLATVICGPIFFVLQNRNLAAIRGQIAVVTQERDKFQRDIELLSSGRRALLAERDDWRGKAEAAEKQIATLQRERDQLRKKLEAVGRDDVSARPSPSP